MVYKKIEYLTAIKNNVGATLYFIERKNKVLLPVEVGGLGLENERAAFFSDLLPENNSPGFSVKDSLKSSVPSIYDSITRMLAGLSAKLEGVKIYLHFEKVFYAYLMIQSSRDSFDINVGFLDAVYLANKVKCPILINQDILGRLGIKLTAEMIENALLKE